MQKMCQCPNLEIPIVVGNNLQTNVEMFAAHYSSGEKFFKLRNLEYIFLRVLGAGGLLPHIQHTGMGCWMGSYFLFMGSYIFLLSQ